VFLLSEKKTMKTDSNAKKDDCACETEEATIFDD